METVAEAVLCSEKEPPVADTDPGFTEALEGLCAFSSPNQFSSSPEVGMWRQENGSIYRQRESPSSCLVELVERVSPTLALSLKCRGRASPSRANSHPHWLSLCPMINLSPSAHCTPGPQNPSGSLCLGESRWKTPISSQRRHGAIWPRSSKVKAKWRSGV